MTIASGFGKDADLALILSKENYRDEIAHASPSCPMLLISMPGPKRMLRFLLGLYRFNQWLQRNRPDVVHFQEMPKGFTFLCWLLCRRSKRVLTIHDVTSHPGQDAKTSSRQEFIKNHMRNTADAVIVHGDNLRTQLAKIDAAFAPKTFVIPHPAFRTLDALDYKPAQENRLLFFGRISKYKGLRYLLEAALMLQERNFPFMLVIAGQGDDLEKNAALLEKIHSKKMVDRRIEPAEIDSLFTETDLVVLPYIEASQSGVAAYALGFGKPCVATRTGSLPEVVQDRFNGLLCAPANAEELADCIEEILSDPDLLRRFAHNSHAMATGRFSPRNIAQSTCQVYQTLIPSLSAEPSESVS